MRENHFITGQGCPHHNVFHLKPAGKDPWAVNFDAIIQNEKSDRGLTAVGAMQKCFCADLGQSTHRYFQLSQRIKVRLDLNVFEIPFKKAIKASY